MAFQHGRRVVHGSADNGSDNVGISMLMFDHAASLQQGRACRDATSLSVIPLLLCLPMSHHASAFLRRLAAAAACLLLLVGCVLAPALPARADSGRYLRSSSYAELASEIASLRPSAGSTTTPLTADQQRRLEDLTALQKAIASSDDRAQIRNRSSHSVGIFARYKKEPIGTPASFYVLGPGHETDDDYELVGLYVPSGVSLRWGVEGGAPATSTGPRVARVLEGQRLRLKDGVPVPAEPATETRATTTAPGSFAYTPPTSATTRPRVPASRSAPAPAPSSASATPAASPVPAVASGAPQADPVVYALDLPVFSIAGSSDAVVALPTFLQSELDLQPETAPLD